MSTASTDRRQGLTSDKGMKAPVRCATTANITLSGLQTIDGIALAADDYVLVKDQNDESENGIWIANSSDWTRRSDASDVRDLADGTTVYVSQGTVNNGHYYVLSGTEPITPGTTDITFAAGVNTDIEGLSRTYVDPSWHFGIGTTASATNMLIVQSDGTEDALSTIGATVQIQRMSDADYGITAPKALKVSWTQDNTLVTASNEWVISGDMQMYNTGGGNTISVSGITERQVGAGASNTAFGGHFQSKDAVAYASALDVSSAVAVEMNVSAKGVDHPTANGNMGRRIVLHVLAHGTSAYGAAGNNAEIGRGIAVETEAGANGAYFRTALDISESSGNANAIGKAIHVVTTGTHAIDIDGVHTTADMVLGGNSAYGIICNGTYTNAAIRINSGQYISLSGTSTHKVLSGTGTPESVVTASVGSLFLRRDGGASTCLYIKESGTGNTGWVAK